jgi:hypothetical protein
MKKIVSIVCCMLLLTTICSAFGATATQTSDLPEVSITIKGGFGLRVIVTNTGDIPIEKFVDDGDSAPGALGLAAFTGRTIFLKQFGGGAGFNIDNLPVDQSMTFRTFAWFHKGISGGKFNITIYENGDMFNQNGISNEVFGSQTFRVLTLGRFFVIALTK